MKENLETLEEQLSTLTAKINGELGQRFRKIEDVTDRLDDEAFKLMEHYSHDLKKKRREKREYQLDFKDVTGRLNYQDDALRGMKQDVENLRLALIAVD